MCRRTALYRPEHGNHRRFIRWARTDLTASDPEFAAIRDWLIYWEVYAEEKLAAKLRELVILVVVATNQAMNAVKHHTAASLAADVKPEETHEAFYLIPLITLVSK